MLARREDDGAEGSLTPAMHVGLNLIFLVPGETGGMEVAARELIPALLAAAPADTRFTAFVNREAAAAGGPWAELLPVVSVPVNARNRVQWVLGEQTLLPILAARAGVDLLHSMASTAPLWGRFRRVVTVHDLIYARFPQAHAGVRDKGMRVLVPAAARRSDRVIADSRSTRDDLVALLGLDPERIDDVIAGCVTQVGEQLVASVEEAGHPLVAGVRGRGLWLAIVLTAEVAAKVEGAARQAGFLVNAVQPDAVRLAPPLILSAGQARQFTDALPSILDAAQRIG